MHAEIVAILAARMMKDPRWVASLTQRPMLVPTGCSQDGLGESMSDLVGRLAGDGVLPAEVAQGLHWLSNLIFVRPG